MSFNYYLYIILSLLVVALAVDLHVFLSKVKPFRTLKRFLLSIIRKILPKRRIRFPLFGVFKKIKKIVPLRIRKAPTRIRKFIYSKPRKKVKVRKERPRIKGKLLFIGLSGRKVKIPKVISSRKLELLNLSVLIVVIAIFSYSYIAMRPQIIHNYPLTDSNWEDYSKPLEVELNLPVEKSRLNPLIEPSIKGKWVWENYLGIKGITTKGKFFPEESLFPDQRIVVYITGVGKTIFPKENHEYGFTFFAPKEPEIQKIYPDENSKLAKTDTIFIGLDKNTGLWTDWKFDIEPKLEYSVVRVFDEVVALSPKNSFAQGTTYKITVVRQPKRVNLVSGEVIEYGEEKDLKSVNYQIAKEPLVENFSPQGGNVKVDSAISVKFQMPMRRESVESNIEITPAIKGKLEWQDDLSFKYTPETNLPKETKYSFKLKKGTFSLERGILEKDVIFEFVTIGAVKVASFSPQNNAGYVSEGTWISVAFDQEVDKESAQAHFSISPGVAGSFSWDGNIMHYIPSGGLSYSTTYTAVVGKGVKTIYGLDSRDDFSTVFTVRPYDIVLYLPLYYQPAGSFSCNIYTAIMALAWKGFYTSAAGLIGEIGYNDNTIDGHWAGNPYAEYVGNSDGSWGYGVYASALQSVFSNRGIYTEARYNWNLSELSQSIANGHPVIVWRYNGLSSYYDKSWTDANGNYVYAINGQHGSVVTGFEGSIGNPSYVYLNDPWLGNVWLDAYTFDYYWSTMGRMALVIY